MCGEESNPKKTTKQKKKKKKKKQQQKNNKKKKKKKKTTTNKPICNLVRKMSPINTCMYQKWCAVIGLSHVDV